MGQSEESGIGIWVIVVLCASKEYSDSVAKRPMRWMGGWPAPGSGISGWPSFFLCNLFAAARECNKRHAVIFNISFASDSSAVIKRNVCFCYICCCPHVPCIRKLGLLLFVVAFLAIAIVEQGNNSPPFKSHSRTLSLSFAVSIWLHFGA